MHVYFLCVRYISKCLIYKTKGRIPSLVGHRAKDRNACKSSSFYFSDTNEHFRVYNMKLSLTPTLKRSWHFPHCTDPELKHRRGVTSRLFRC